MDRDVNQIYEQIREIARDEVRKMLSSDKWGTAQSASSDGSVEVLFDGGEDPTPCTTLVKVHKGDRVLLNVDPVSRSAVVKGNYTKPSATDEELATVSDLADKVADYVDYSSDAAETIAERVTVAEDGVGKISDYVGVAEEYEKTLSEQVEAAQKSADDAAEAAESAGESAATAKKAADSSLEQLSIVEDVIGVLTWVSNHGDYAATSDTEVVSGKYYFTRGGSSPNYTYSVVLNPSGNPRSRGWYELTDIDQAVTEYVLTHLSLTSRGLWVLPSGVGSASSEQYAPGGKMLVASDGTHIYDSSGTEVGLYGSVTRIGSEGGMNVLINSSGIFMRNKTVTKVELNASNGRLILTDGGSSKVVLGSNSASYSNPGFQIYYDNAEVSEWRKSANGAQIAALARMDILGFANTENPHQTNISLRDNSIYSSHAISTGSDRRLKEHQEYLGDDAVELVRSLKPALYKRGDRNELGFYAQDVQEADPWDALVQNTGGDDLPGGTLALNYTELIAPLVAYCQRLEERVSELEKGESV